MIRWGCIDSLKGVLFLEKEEKNEHQGGKPPNVTTTDVREREKEGGSERESERERKRKRKKESV